MDLGLRMGASGNQGPRGYSKFRAYKGNLIFGNSHLGHEDRALKLDPRHNRHARLWDPAALCKPTKKHMSKPGISESSQASADARILSFTRCLNWSLNLTN